MWPDYSIVVDVSAKNNLLLCLKAILLETIKPKEIVFITRNGKLVNEVIKRLETELEFYAIEARIVNKRGANTLIEVVDEVMYDYVLLLNGSCIVAGSFVHKFFKIGDPRVSIGFGQIIQKDKINPLYGVIYHKLALVRILTKKASWEEFSCACILKSPLFYITPENFRGRSVQYPYWYIKTCAKNPDVLWTVLMIDPFAIPLTFLVANFTNWKPNQITIFSIFFSLIGIYFFLQGGYIETVIGGLIYELVFLMDCIDGKLSRAKKEGTPIGHFMDQAKDRVLLLANLWALGYGQFARTGEEIYLVLSFCYMLFDAYKRIFGMYYSQAKNSAKRIVKDIIYLKTIHAGSRLTKLSLNPFYTYLYLKRRLRPYRIVVKPVDVELEALVFLIGPLLFQIKAALLFAVCYQLLLFLLMNVVRMNRLVKMEGAKEVISSY